MAVRGTIPKTMKALVAYGRGDYRFEPEYPCLLYTSILQTMAVLVQNQPRFMNYLEKAEPVP